MGHQKENQSNFLAKLKEKQGVLDAEKNNLKTSLDSIKEKSKEVKNNLDDAIYEYDKQDNIFKVQTIELDELKKEQNDLRLKIDNITECIKENKSYDIKQMPNSVNLTANIINPVNIQALMNK